MHHFKATILLDFHVPNVSQALKLFDGEVFNNKKEDALEHCLIINAILF